MEEVREEVGVREGSRGSWRGAVKVDWTRGQIGRRLLTKRVDAVEARGRPRLKWEDNWWDWQENQSERWGGGRDGWWKLQIPVL